MADVIDAMSSHRPYRPALGVEAAVREVAARSGTEYDPAVVAAATALWQEGALGALYP